MWLFLTRSAFFVPNPNPCLPAAYYLLLTAYYPSPYALTPASKPLSLPAYLHQLLLFCLAP